MMASVEPRLTSGIIMQAIFSPFVDPSLLSAESCNTFLLFLLNDCLDEALLCFSVGDNTFDVVKFVFISIFKCSLMF